MANTQAAASGKTSSKVVAIAAAVASKMLDTIAEGLTSTHGNVTAFARGLASGAIRPEYFGQWFAKQKDAARRDMVKRQIQNALRKESKGKVTLKQDKESKDFILSRPQTRSTSRQEGTQGAEEGQDAKGKVRGDVKQVTPEALLSFCDKFIGSRKPSEQRTFADGIMAMLRRHKLIEGTEVVTPPGPAAATK